MATAKDKIKNTLNYHKDNIYIYIYQYEKIFMNSFNKCIAPNGCAGVITTQVFRGDDIYIVEAKDNIKESKLLGGFGTKGSTNQYRTQNRVYSSSSSPTLSTGFNPNFSEHLRIRKLTPRECGRLMGVKDEDIDLILENQTNASAYHLFGDSIVVNCLMALYSTLFDKDWQESFKPEEWWKK